MIKGRIYINQTTGGFYECTSAEGAQGVALMSLVMVGYEGNDPKRRAVFVNEPEDVAHWKLATDDDLTDEIVRARRVIKGHYEHSRYFREVAISMEEDVKYLEGKKSNGV